MKETFDALFGILKEKSSNCTVFTFRAPQLKNKIKSKIIESTPEP